MTRLKVDEKTRVVLRRTATVLRTAREEAGLSQAQLAQSISMARENYAKIEHADVNVTVDTLVRIARGLGRQVQFELVRPTRASFDSVHVLQDSARGSDAALRFQRRRDPDTKPVSPGNVGATLIRVIQAAVAKRELSVARLARAAKLSALDLQAILRGDQSPTLEVVERLAAALGVSPLDLLTPAKPRKRLPRS